MGVHTCKCSWKRIGRTCAMAAYTSALINPNRTKKRPFEIAVSEKIFTNQFHCCLISSENTFDNQHGVHHVRKWNDKTGTPYNYLAAIKLNSLTIINSTWRNFRFCVIYFYFGEIWRTIYTSGCHIYKWMK